MCKLEVNINEKEKYYPIFISNENIDNLQTSIMSEVKNNNYIIVISEKVYKLYAKLLNFQKEKIYILKDGEKEKNFDNYRKILDFALKNRLTRQDYIIAIGGGVVGDLAGFCASCYMRGINFIQVPTTLLACTDSSVGGKTAINTKYGKNLIGAFHQPKAVFINVNFLKTLDNKQFKSGLGEVLKYGFIEKSCQCEEEFNLLNFLSENTDKILARDILTLQELIKICVKLKISVVNKDEKESSLRKILNYGHTYGHAVEKITNYKKYTHGECVVEGIYKILDIAFKMGKISKEYYFLCKDLLIKYGFETMPKFNKNKIFYIMQTDKKADDNFITLILPSDYSQVEITKFKKDEILSLL